MYHYPRYTVMNGLTLIALGIAMMFFPQVTDLLADFLADPSTGAEFQAPDFPAALVVLLQMVGPLAVATGGYRVIAALFLRDRNRRTASTSTYLGPARKAEQNKALREAQSAQAAWAERAQKAEGTYAGSVSPVSSAVRDRAATRAAEAYTAIKTDAERLAERWTRSRTRHLEVKDAYAEIITDPLNALTHSVLFDVSDARTQAFIIAYTKADDLFDIHAAKTRTAELVEEYENAVLLLPSRWDDALRYAEKVGSGWLPEEDAKLVTTATSLIQRARNTSSEAESALSWKKAKDHIDQIRAFHLPVAAADVLEQRVRGQLTPATA